MISPSANIAIKNISITKKVNYGCAFIKRFFLDTKKIYLSFRATFSGREEDIFFVLGDVSAHIHS